MTTPSPKHSLPRRAVDILRQPWTMAALGVAAIVVGLAGLLPLRHEGVWFHLWVGRVVWELGAVVSANHVLYTLPDQAPSIVVPWLSDTLLFGSYKLMDLEGVLWVRNHLWAIAMGLSAWIAGWRAKTWHEPLFYGVLGAAVVGLSPEPDGPQMFAAPLWVASLGCCLWRATCAADRTLKQDALGLGLLAGCAALWANLDVSYPLILLPVLGLAAAALCAAAATLNPHGLWTHAHTASLLLARIDHPAAPTWASIKSLPAASIVAAAFAARLTLTLHPWNKAQQTRPGFYLGLGLMWALVALALTHARAAAWFGLAMPMVYIWSVRGIVLTKTPAASKPLTLKRTALIVLLASTLPILTQPIFMTHEPLARTVPWFKTRGVQPHATTLPARVPLEAMQMIKRHRSPRERLYVDQSVTGYALFELQPQRPLMMLQSDARVELLSQAQWDQLKLLEETDIWRGLFQQWDVQMALLHKKRQATLVDAMRTNASWHMQYEDDQWIYFARK